MKRGLKRMISSLALIFGAAACETSQEVARKPQIAEAFVSASVAQCEVGNDSLAYAAHLRSTLMEITTKRLEILTSQNLTICLDTRLNSQKVDSTHQFLFGWTYTDDALLGQLYNSDHPTVSLLAERNSPVKLPQGYPTKLINKYLLEDLAVQYAQGRLPQDTPTLYAHTYTRHVGTAVTTAFGWTAKFDTNTLRKNPQLKTPPLRVQRP